MGKKVKVGVLTLPLHTNYGGNLQAYALMMALKKNGFEPILLNRQRNKYNPVRYLVSIPKGLIDKYILKKPAPIFDFLKAKLEYNKISVNARQFINDYIYPKTAPLYSGKDLAEECNNIKPDAIVVGSDQVWKPSYTPNISDYFLSFANSQQLKSVKKISYAASFGNDNWKFTDSQTAACAKLVKQFDSISVREDLAVEQCEKFFGVDAAHVLDPSLLLESSDYLKIFSHLGQERNDTITSYVLDKSAFIDSVFSNVSSYFDASISKLNARTEELNAPTEERIAPPVEDWLHGIYSAKLLVTDSFHGCAFAILFNVPFIVIGNERRGIARFNSLLRLFDLEVRMVKTEQDIDAALRHSIDWEVVNEKLLKYRKNSLMFLLAALQD